MSDNMNVVKRLISHNAVVTVVRCVWVSNGCSKDVIQLEIEMTDLCRNCTGLIVTFARRCIKCTHISELVVIYEKFSEYEPTTKKMVDWFEIITSGRKIFAFSFIIVALSRGCTNAAGLHSYIGIMWIVSFGWKKSNHLSFWSSK